MDTKQELKMTLVADVLNKNTAFLSEILQKAKDLRYSLTPIGDEPSDKKESTVEPNNLLNYLHATACKQSDLLSQIEKEVSIIQVIYSRV